MKHVVSFCFCSVIYPIGNNKLEHGYPYEPMSIWSQQSHECCKKYCMKFECECKKLDINGKVIPSKTSHR